MSRRRREPAARTETKVGTPPLPLWRWPTSSIAWMARTRVETRARARVLQALYAWDMRGNGGGSAALERVATQVWDDLAITPEERRIAGPIVRLVASRQQPLDAELADVTTNWRLER